MTKTFVIVPVRNEWEHTRRLLACLDAGEVDDVLVLDNGSTDETAQRIRQWQGGARSRLAEHYPLGGKLHRVSRPEDSIYELWNHGFARARRLAAREPFCVLVTNNDIILPRGAVGLLRAALQAHPVSWVAYPDYTAPWLGSEDVTGREPEVRFTRGVLGDGGMFGACFMLAGHRIPWTPLVTDTTYQWWYGDNHLAEEIEQHGGQQARVVWMPVQHVNEATARHDPTIYTKKYADRQRWITRYQRDGA